MTKADQAEEKIMDPSGDPFVTAAKHMIEYCIASYYPTILDLLGIALFFHPGTSSVRKKDD